MPLSMIGEGETATITRIGGKEETRRFLENLGFVVLFRPCCASIDPTRTSASFPQIYAR